MKRELKFRVWDIKDSCWHNSNILEVFGDTLKALYSYSKEDEDNFIIQQYTGFKDVNGKEVYEDDIIKICSNDDLEDLQLELGSVTYKECCFWFDNISPQMLYDFVEDDKLMVEVVGNIFENSELLKK